MMLVTEEQAKERWCPWARADTAHGGSYNRDFTGGPGHGCHCIASQCMAWDWGDTPETVLKRLSSGGDGERRGYCRRVGWREDVE